LDEKDVDEAKIDVKQTHPHSKCDQDCVSVSPQLSPSRRHGVHDRHIAVKTHQLQKHRSYNKTRDFFLNKVQCKPIC